MYLKYVYFLVLLCSIFSGHDCQKATIRHERIQKAQEMKRYMNLSVDPCDDFYEYACGNFKTAFPSKNANMYPISMLQQLEDKTDQELLKLLIQPVKRNENYLHQHLKNFYNSCTDTAQINRIGVEPIKAVIKELGGMPLFENYWDERGFNWINTISELKQKYNMDILIKLSMRDSERKYTKAFYLDSPSYQPIYKMFKTRSEGIGEITGLLQKYSNRNDQIKKVAEEILNIEYNLYKNNPQVLPGKRNEYEELSMYQSKLESIDFEMYTSASVQHVTNSFKSYISTNGYFENLQQTLLSTSRKSIANYIMWNFIRQMNMTNDQEPNMNRRKFCLNQTKQYFPQVLGEMYFTPTPYLSQQIESEIDFLRTRLKSALETNGLEWMENNRDIRSNVQHKLTNMNINYIRYNSKDIIESMPPLNRTAIQANQFLHNIFTLMSMQATNVKNKIYSDMTKRSPISQVTVESYSVNPSYQPDQNTIKIPKGMFNYPIYHNEFPNAIKFGQIGVLISREILKSLTTNSNDKTDTWVDRALDKFYERIKCFVEQYKNYKFGDGYLPENEQQMENIADNGAVRVAFLAYLKWLSDVTIPISTLKNETFKNFDFTNTQLFFISYAQTYCSNLSETEERVLPDNKEFIPEKIRVNAALSNFDEFSTEFNCPIGSIMNAPDKCVFY